MLILVVPIVWTVFFILVIGEAIKFAKNPVPRLSGKDEESIFGEALKQGYVHKMYIVCRE